jgi:hypothetical protein
VARAESLLINAMTQSEVPGVENPGVCRSHPRMPKRDAVRLKGNGGVPCPFHPSRSYSPVSWTTFVAPVTLALN